jgi:hypothetical protein
LPACPYGWVSSAVTLFLGRLSSLRAMSDPHSPQWQHSTLLLRVEDWGEEDDWGDDKEQPAGGDERRPTDGNRSQVVWGEDGYGGPIIIQFIPAVSTGLSDWQFRKGDPDPFPSVPHGHRIADIRRKLDPYRGFTYLKGWQDGRVSRASTIALWNDTAFRQFAHEAIYHFVAQHPHWNWMGRDPFKLPRRR